MWKRMLKAAAGLTTAAALYLSVIRPWHLRWGATTAECRSELLFYLLFEPGDFVMMRKMMGTTKQRAEALSEGQIA